MLASSRVHSPCFIADALRPTSAPRPALSRCFASPRSIMMRPPRGMRGLTSSFYLTRGVTDQLAMTLDCRHLISVSILIFRLLKLTVERTISCHSSAISFSESEERLGGTSRSSQQHYRPMPTGNPKPTVAIRRLHSLTWGRSLAQSQKTPIRLFWLEKIQPRSFI